MMEYLFENVGVATLDETKPYLDKAFVAVSGGKISHVGEAPPKDASRYERINGSDKLLMPGLINAHTHIPMTLLRGYADDYDLHTWLNDYIFPAEAKLDGRAVKAGALLGMAEAIMSGTTSISDMYDFCDEIIEAVLESGIKANVSRALTHFGGAFDFNSHKGARELRAILARWHGADEGRVLVEAGIHAEYTSPPELWRAVADFAAENGLGVQVHLSETESEHRECVGRHGKTPAAALGDAGVWDGRALAAHAVWVSDEDIALLAEKGVSVAHNPVSNGKLGSGVCPVPELKRAGVNVALGTDGVSSNNSHDMFEEMKTALIIQRAVKKDPLALSKMDVLRMATRCGAKAQGREAECGEIKVGMDADLILLDFTRPNLVPANDALSSLVFSATGANVCMNMVRGKVLYKDGEFTTLDIERIIREVRGYAVPRILG